jgi:iron complex transport system ATP-binding protein
LALIEIKDLSYQYGLNSNGNSFKLSIQNLEIARGNFVSIIGPNGCGKSTLLKILAGINTPFSGSVKIDGCNYSELNRKEYSKKISYVPQSIPSIFPFSVYEIVMMGRTPYLNFMGFEKKEDRSIVEEAMEILELNHIRNKGINEISGGELQRVFIARALAQRSEIILLDEPNSHLDIQHQIVIFDLMAKLCSDKKFTVIAVSHDLNMVGIYSDEVVFMKEGRIAIYGDKKSIFTKENISEIFNVATEVKFNEHGNAANVLIKPQ